MSSSLLIEQLLHTTSAIGYDKTLELLKNAQYGGLTFANTHVEFVVTGVGDKFGIPAHEIYYGVGRKNDRKWAIGFCVYYLKNIYRVEIEKIAEMINKSYSACCKYCSLVEKLNIKFRNDAYSVYVEYKNHFDKLFTIDIKK